MGELLARLLSVDGFMPHGHCYQWRPELLWLHVVSDVLIGLSYLSIPLTLAYFIRRRRDLPFSWMFVCFGVFIVACGATHWMEVWAVWTPVYWLAGWVKALTALASVPTAVLLVRLMPRMLALPSPEQLRQANRRLAEEVEERRAAEARLRSLTEEMDRRNRDLEAFAAAASHDLQSPLRKIQVLTSRVQEHLEGPGAEEQRQLLVRAQDSAARMQDLVHKLLELARVSVRDQAVEPVALEACLDGVLSDLELRIQEAGASVERGPLPVVLAAPVHVRQLLQNLVENGLKYRRPGFPPKVSLSSEPAPGRPDRTWVRVADDGPGIPEGRGEEILQPFRRLDPVYGADGHGLGLAICAKIVETYGGNLTLEQHPGAGAVFRFDLPLARPAAGPAPAPVAGSSNGGILVNPNRPSGLAAQEPE